jgi:hypothetical protein
LTEVIIPRTTVPFTTDGSGNPTFQPDGGNIQRLADVGPMHIDGLCRHTWPGSDSGSGPGGSEHGPSHPAGFFTATGGEDEAHVIVWVDPSAGSLTFTGRHGKRHNVPPGPPDYSQGTPGASPPNGGSNPGHTDRAHSPEPNGPVTNVGNPVAGEGQHMFLSATNETVDENRATDPAADNQSDPSVTKLKRYPAYEDTTGLIGTADGHLATVSVLAGFDVLGVGDQCVFAGVVRPFS